MQRVFAVMVLVSSLLVACSQKSNNASVKPVAAEPLFEGMGSHTRKITTGSSEAQRYFDQGLAFLFGFNHDEAIRSFRQATALDTSSAMAWWGVSIANGPHINNPVMDSTHAYAAFDAWQAAKNREANATETERALIDALGSRYANPQPADRHPQDEAYAAAMREVWHAHPDDPDVGALFAEAMMDLRPWRLWTHDGQPEPGTEEIVETLEQILSKWPQHPLANHLYIHAVEASPHPDRADSSADRLRDMEPGLGHMVHMPSHIDVRTGRWAEAQAANEKAIEVDRAYREKSPQQGFYRIYMAHNHHMLSYAAIMQGEQAVALAAIHRGVSAIPAEFIQEAAPLVDGFMAMPLEIEMRFGLWDSVLAAPEFPDILPLSRLMRHFARGTAYAAKGMLPEAKAEQTTFLAGKSSIASEATFGNNSATNLLNVAEHMLAGEILVRAGEKEKGVAELRQAVRAEDGLVYDEPPDWILPVRHALGATLLNMGRAKEAEAVYREDLVRIPGNGWSLFGLARALEMQKKTAEAAQVKSDFDKVWSKADIQLSSSCFCQPGV
jgi:tetratricopeptide (TPR) repeat protein